MNRRDYLATVSAVSIGGIAGCGGSGGTPESEETSGNLQDQEDTESCTDAYMTNTDWILDGDQNVYTGTLINRADVAGEVGVDVEFLNEDDQRVGTLTRSVAIGGQETKEIEIYGTPPSDRVEGMRLEVTEQDCQ